MLQTNNPVISSCHGTEKSQEQLQIQRNWRCWDVPILPSHRNTCKWKKWLSEKMLTGEDYF